MFSKRNWYKTVFYNKLNMIYLEIPKFNKPLHELKSDYDRWLYAFKNLHKLKEMPKELEQGIFKRLFKLAEIENSNRWNVRHIPTA